MTKNSMLYIGIAVLVIAVVGGGLLLNKNKATKNETLTQTTQSPSVPSKTNATQPANSGKTEEAYIELLAQRTYNNQNGWTSQNEKDLFAKYGVTQEEIDAFRIALRTDTALSKAVTIKVLQRTQELQRTGN